MPNSTITPTSFTAMDVGFRKIHIQELRNAITNLDNLKGNVQNCNCANSNCCQSSSCQTTACQSCQACQTCQTCQGGSQCNCANCSETH